MTTEQLLEIKLQLNERVTNSSQALTSYCKPFRGEMGLVSDECKQSKEYKILQQNYNADFQSLRAFNKVTSKNKDLQKAVKANILARRKAVA